MAKRMSPFRCLLVAATLCAVGCGSGGDPREFVLALTPTHITVMQGYTTPAIAASVNKLFGLKSDVDVAATIPAGFTCTPACEKQVATSSDFHFTTTQSTPLGDSVFTFHGTGEVVARDLPAFPHDGTVTVTVTPYDPANPPPPDFELDVSPALFQTQPPPSRKGFINISYQLTVIRFNNYTGPVEVELKLPNSQEFSCSPCSVVMTGDTAHLVVTAFPQRYGYSPIDFIGTAGPTTHTTEVLFDLYPALPKSGPPSGAGA